MKLEDKIKICKTCQNRVFNMETGINCGLTNLKPDFEVKCDYYSQDPATIAHARNMDFLLATASNNKRLINYLLDWFFLNIVTFTFDIIFYTFMYFDNSTELLNDNKDIYMLFLLAILIKLSYYIGLEAAFGKTLAKFITKTKVVDNEGNKAKMDAIIIRTLCRFIPFEQLSFLGSDSSGLHDKLSKTLVIDDED